MCTDGSNATTQHLGFATVADYTTELDTLATHSASCTATVGDYDACFSALSTSSDSQLCTETSMPAACDPFNVPACSS